MPSFGNSRVISRSAIHHKIWVWRQCEPWVIYLYGHIWCTCLHRYGSVVSLIDRLAYLKKILSLIGLLLLINFVSWVYKLYCMKKSVWLLIGTLLGIGIAYIDTRLYWSDNGVSLCLILLISTLCSHFYNSRPWLLALSIGIWIPVFNIVLFYNFNSLVALVPAFVGSYIGYFFTRKSKIVEV